MRILVVGTGGVGGSVAPIAARRDFYEHIVFADHHPGRAQAVVDRYDGGTGRFSAAVVDASDPTSVAAVAKEHGIDHILNAVDPRFVMPVFEGAFEAGATYMDMALSTSEPHPERPYELVGKKLGTTSSPRRRDGRRPAGSPSWGAASSRDCPTCSRATPRTTCSPRSRT